MKSQSSKFPDQNFLQSTRALHCEFHHLTYARSFMKQVFNSFASLILLILASAFLGLSPLQAQVGGTKGVPGKSIIQPKLIHFSDLPPSKPGKNLSGPKKSMPELEPPETPVVPPPRIEDLPNVTIDRTVSPETPSGPLAPTQVGSGFNGVNQGPYIPTEPSAAAGPLNLFMGSNSSVAVVNRDGTNRTEIDGSAFFGIPAAEGAYSDPVQTYDALQIGRASCRERV